MSKGFSYGGQAVIEGVMMRGRSRLAIAVRKADNSIIVREEAVRSASQRLPFLRLPIIRGVVALVESLVVGLRALSFSASAFAEEEGEELGFGELAVTMAVAFVLAVGLFVVLPAFLVKQFHNLIASDIILNLVEGLIKVAVFLTYIIVISTAKDIRRVFEYHGAEHKAIHCYEAGEELTVENARKFTTMHPRCGTNFMLLVLVTSVFVFSFFGRPPFLQRILLHLAILPLVAGLSYELIKLAGKYKVVRMLVYPGLLLQKLTTREPNDEQLEVAIRALKTVLTADNALHQRDNSVESQISTSFVH